MLLLQNETYMDQTLFKMYRKSTLSLWFKQKLKSMLNIEERTCRRYCRLYLGTKQTSTNSKEEAENTVVFQLNTLFKHICSVLYSLYLENVSVFQSENSKTLLVWNTWNCNSTFLLQNNNRWLVWYLAIYIRENLHEITQQFPKVIWEISSHLSIWSHYTVDTSFPYHKLVKRFRYQLCLSKMEKHMLFAVG